MATDVKKAANDSTDKSTEEKVVATAQHFWQKNGKNLSYALSGIILVVAGYFIYLNYFKAPEEQKASESIWVAQIYFKEDSFHLALNGDGMNPGFLRVISKYGGTQSGNLAKFYAGASYLQLGDFNNAVKYLKDFSTDQPLLKVQATGLLGDAYAELGKKEEAVDYYKKAGTIYEKDNLNSPLYMFRGAMLYQSMGKNQEAIELLNQLKDKYPQSQQAGEADKYLGKLGDLK